jgi:arabinofuranosyltransferase
MKKAYVSIILSAIIFLILLLHVNYLRFVCDDAFISFRYAKNFVEGHGLVYNIDERVEGYTNFLWTFLLSLFMKIGLDVVVVSQVLGVLFSLSTILLLLRLNRWLYPSKNLFNYLGPLLLVCCGAYAAWSTGGLETSFFTFLVLLGSYFFITGINKTASFIFSGITFALIGMTRLDGVIFGGITFLFLLYLSVVKNKIELKNLLLWIISFLIPFLVYFIWRWSYYGRFLPNTFYVKVGEESLYCQGLFYLFNFVKRFWIWIMVIPLAFLGKALRSNANLKMFIPYFASTILVFSFYISYIGGDFMDMFRFIVPILPFFFFLVQEGFRGMYYSSLPRLRPKRLSKPQSTTSRGKRIVWVSLEMLLIGLSLVLLTYPSKESNQVWNRNGIDSIGLLRDYTRLWSKVGLTFKSLAKPGESLSTGAAGAIPYYSELYTIDELYLTFRSQPGLKVLKARRAGHQMMMTDEFLVTLRPTYIVAHPQIHDEYKKPEDLFVAELYSRAGYKPMTLPIKISDNDTMYLYGLSLRSFDPQ